MAGETMKSLYEQDLYEWTLRSADLLRRGCYAELDIEHLVEELEAMAGRDKRELKSRITAILEHKLKLLVTSGPLLERNRAGWNLSVSKQQDEIRSLVEQSPSLSRDIEALVPLAYRTAAKHVRIGLPDRSSEPPDVCPWNTEEILGPKE